jgi:hypothetical protein
MEELTTQEEIVLLGARDGLSYREIGANIGRTKSWVQILLRDLIAKKYLEHARYKHRALKFTQKAKNYFAERGMKYDRRDGDSSEVRKN